MMNRTTFRILSTISRIARVTLILLVLTWISSILFVLCCSSVSLFVAIPFTYPTVKTLQSILYKSELAVLRAVSLCLSLKPSLHILVKNDILTFRGGKKILFKLVWFKMLEYLKTATLFVFFHLREVFVFSCFLCVGTPTIVAGYLDLDWLQVLNIQGRLQIHEPISEEIPELETLNKNKTENEKETENLYIEFTYDPVYGKIPSETKNLWESQSTSNSPVTKTPVTNKIPPIRFSDIIFADN